MKCDREMFYNITKNSVINGRWSNNSQELARRFQSRLLEAIITIDSEIIYFENLIIQFKRLVDWGYYAQTWIKEMIWSEVYYSLSQFNFIEIPDNLSGYLYFNKQNFNKYLEEIKCMKK